MYLDYLMFAYTEKIKSKGVGYDPCEDHSYFGNIFREILSQSSSWPHNVINLIDSSNWQIDKLVQSYDRMRKPVAYIFTEINIRGNLTVDWYPTRIPYDTPKLEESDWIRWGNTWNAGTQPFNRIITIKGFDGFARYVTRKKTEESDYCLFRAIEELLKSVYSFMEISISINMVKDLYIEYSDKGIKHHNVLSYHIRDVEDLEREQVAKKKQEWLDYLSGTIGMTAEQFLEIFKASGSKYKEASKQLSLQQVNLTEKTIKSWVEKLYDYPEIYDRIFDEPPKGITPRKKAAQLIKVDFSKK